MMNSFVDEFDDRIFRNGQVIGVKHGGSVHQPTITYSTIPQRLPDPGPRYGESRPPVIYDFTENPFYRTPRYGGGLNIPGAPGNIQKLPYYGGLFNPTTMPYYPGQDYGGVQQFAQMLPPIDPASHRNQMKQKKIYEKGKRTDNPYEADAFLRRTGPQLPLAQAPANFDRKYVS